MNGKKHFTLTGVSNRLILENARKIVKSGSRIVIRIPIIPGFNDYTENIVATVAFVKELGAVERIGLLPYHRFGMGKYEQLGKEYSLKGDIKVPEREEMEEIRLLVESLGVKAKVGY